jgi:hypothetical protein
VSQAQCSLSSAYARVGEERTTLTSGVLSRRLERYDLGYFQYEETETPLV